MNRWHLLIVFMALPAIVLAQAGTSQHEGPSYANQPYQPAVPAPSMNTNYGYSGYYGGGGGTVAGSSMTGMANAISAKGSANLSNSAAALNMTQVQKNEIQNQQLGEQTYFAMKDENEAWNKAHAAKTPTPEQLARMARDAAPKPVSASEVDPASGKINWPVLLTQDEYAEQRKVLDQLMATKAKYGRLSYSDQTTSRQTIEAMFDMMKAQIKLVPPQDYVEARTFLQSLIYATSKSELG